MECYHFLFAAMQFVLLLFPSSSLAVHNNLTDFSTMLAFKARISGPYNILSTNWTANNSFCSWSGILCSRRGQRVVALNIVNLPLYGTIAPQVANLSFLSYLNFTNNSFVGPVPDSIAQMPHLKQLCLSENQQSGSIPSAIFNMSLLTALSLSKNNLIGTLPSNLTFIDSIFLEFNIWGWEVIIVGDLEGGRVSDVLI